MLDRFRSHTWWLRNAAFAAALATAAALPGCAATTHRPSGTDSRQPVGLAQAPAAGYSKVLVIPEENKTYRQIIRSRKAPYLNQLAVAYGTATAMDAGYPSHCPSLPGYLLMTSGSDHHICDDADAPEHRIHGDNLFAQVAEAGQEWRVYAESMPAACGQTTANHGLYLPRHGPAPYYTSEESRCAKWDLPLGTHDAGPLHDDLARGALPAFSLVTPDACHDMHGAPACKSGLISAGDTWLRTLIPTILASTDYVQGRLVVIITWDEGSPTNNHIPYLVLSPTTHHIVATRRYTHCSTLRTIEEILRLPLLACAKTAPSLRTEFHI